MMLDLKKVLLPFVSFIRLYSIQNKLILCNSMERTSHLYKTNVLDKRSFESLVQGYEYLMGLRLKFQIQSILQNKEAGNEINTSDLSEMDAIFLKKFMSEINELKARLSIDFGRI